MEQSPPGNETELVPCAAGEFGGDHVWGWGVGWGFV